MYVCMYVFMYVCMYECVYVCMYLSYVCHVRINVSYRYSIYDIYRMRRDTVYLLDEAIPVSNTNIFMEPGSPGAPIKFSRLSSGTGFHVDLGVFISNITTVVVDPIMQNYQETTKCPTENRP